VPLVAPHAGSWKLLVVLGAFHGLNPAMGWLFAVALGMQEHRRRAVWRALLPLGIGHALAVALAIVCAVLLGVALPERVLRWVVAIVLTALGVYFLFHHPHPRWAAMRVSMADLTLWSFLVGTVHGAGAMVVPLFLRLQTAPVAHMHLATSSTTVGLLATAVHAGAYLIVTGVIAIVVYEKIGVGFLRKAWINMDLVWATTLMTTGIVSLLI
jgi:hypothetical protein